MHLRTDGSRFLVLALALGIAFCLDLVASERAEFRPLQRSFFSPGHSTQRGQNLLHPVASVSEFKETPARVVAMQAQKQRQKTKLQIVASDSDGEKPTLSDKDILSAAAPILMDPTLNDGSNMRLLKSKEENVLALLAQRGEAIQAVRNELRAKLGRPASAEELAEEVLGPSAKTEQLARLFQCSRRAKQMLIRANGGLVLSTALYYSRQKKGALIEDLVQEGNLGLIRAVEKFDAGRGFRFSTYATAWVRGTMSTYLKGSDSLIPIPERVRNLGSKAAKASSTLTGELGRDPTAEELAEKIGAKEDAVKKAMTLNKRSIVSSFDAGVGSEGDRTWLDCLADDECVTDTYIQDDIRDALAAVLKPKEMRVIRLRYGLDDGVQRSTRDVAQLLGIGRESVRTICLKAFRKLRGTEKGAGLLSYVGEI
jgi:RNA polymerase sigma factor (sigma-70 family)